MAFNKWFQVTTSNTSEGDILEVSISDEIGGWGISAKEFISQIKGEDFIQLHLHISSPGGSVFEGWAIYNFLESLDVPIVVTIDSLGASMASIIAMVGDSIYMPFNSMLMIHDPWTVAIGNAKDLQKDIDLLNKMKDASIKAYQKHSDYAYEDISDMMTEETWLTAEEASEVFKNVQVIEAVPMVATANKLEALKQFKNVPEEWLSALTNKGKENVTRESNQQTEDATPVAEAEPDRPIPTGETEPVAEGQSEVTEQPTEDADSPGQAEGQEDQQEPVQGHPGQVVGDQGLVDEGDREDGLPTEQPEQPDVQSTLTPDAVQKASSQAYEEGYDAGRREAETMIRDEIRSEYMVMITNLNGTVDELQQTLAFMNTESENKKKEYLQNVKKLEERLSEAEGKLSRLNVAMMYSEDVETPASFADAIERLMTQEGFDYDRAYVKARRDYPELFEALNN